MGKTADRLYMEYTDITDHLLTNVDLYQAESSETGKVLFGSFIALVRKMKTFATLDVFSKVFPRVNGSSFFRNNLNGCEEALTNTNPLYHRDMTICQCVYHFKLMCRLMCRTELDTSTYDLLNALSHNFDDLHDVYHTCTLVSAKWSWKQDLVERDHRDNLRKAKMLWADQPERRDAVIKMSEAVTQVLLSDQSAYAVRPPACIQHSLDDILSGQPQMTRDNLFDQYMMEQSFLLIMTKYPYAGWFSNKESQFHEFCMGGMTDHELLQAVSGVTGDPLLFSYDDADKELMNV